VRSASPCGVRGGVLLLRLAGGDGHAIEHVDIRTLSMWPRYDGADRLTTRVVDATGQCHQIALKLRPTDQWQQVIFPLERSFEGRGKPDAVAGLAKYEYWGGAKDGKWHGPAVGANLGLALIVNEDDGPGRRSFMGWFGDVHAKQVDTVGDLILAE